MIVKPKHLDLLDSKTCFLLMDNPGCNEFGSEQIARSVNKANVISSGFVFITTMDTYKDSTSSTIFKKIYERNKGMCISKYFGNCCDNHYVFCFSKLNKESEMCRSYNQY